MTFGNPWIDPRIGQMKPADAGAYLLNHGWIQVESANPNMTAFASSSNPEEASVVCVPQLDQARDYPLRVIELISDLALVEKRWAVDVLSDILQARTAPAVGNGAAVGERIGS